MKLPDLMEEIGGCPRRIQIRTITHLRGRIDTIILWKLIVRSPGNVIVEVFAHI